MKKTLFAVFLLGILTACAPAQPTIDTQSTALAIVQTGIALTQTALPTFTPTATVVYPTPSPLPTQPPFPVITPDAIQVERWREYQAELAKSIFPHDPPEWFLCEWDILGRSGQEVYAWAVCGVGERSGSVPVVIYLNADGSIQNVKKPKNWSIENIHKMFPEDVRNKFDYLYAGEIQKMLEHLEWREGHPEELPLVILGGALVVTLTP